MARCVGRPGLCAFRCHIGWVAFVICYDETERRNVTVDSDDWLAERFEENRTHLRAVAYRMLGSLSEADDAVQEAWLRLGRSDAERHREPGRLADDGRRPGVPGHAALAHVRREEPLGRPACPTRS